MRIIDYKDGSSGEPCVLLLGYFDGVHIGHRALIAAAKEIAAREGVLVGLTTFYDGKNGGQIFTFSERCTLLASLGVDFVYAAQFDAAFRATEGAAFLEHVCAALPVRAFVCGEDYTYGRGAACGVAELSAFAAEHGTALYPQPAVAFGSEKAAATLAKQYLREGDMPRLAELLGGRYFITGTVATEGGTSAGKWAFPRQTFTSIPKNIRCAKAFMPFRQRSEEERTAGSPITAPVRPSATRVSCWNHFLTDLRATCTAGS